MDVQENQVTLSVETATRNCSLALMRAGEIVAAWVGDDGFSASDGLLVEIQNLLRQTAIELTQVNLLTAAIGPGSFTGLRVGLAIVKGLAAAWQIPAIGVSTLAAMIDGQPPDNSICSILPAGRDDFFAQTFNPQQADRANPLQSGKIEEILSELPAKPNWVIVIAPAFQPLVGDFLEQNKINNWTLVAPPLNLAVGVAHTALLARPPENVNSDWQIIYGREAVARRTKLP